MNLPEAVPGAVYDLSSPTNKNANGNVLAIGDRITPEAPSLITGKPPSPRITNQPDPKNEPMSPLQKATYRGQFYSQGAIFWNE